MKVEELAVLAIDACEAEGVDHMVTGAFAVGFYGIPRSTKDVDLVIRIDAAETVGKVVARLEREIVFNPQVEFDTLTWGRRHVGCLRIESPLRIELFELFDDPFVQEQFRRKLKLRSAWLARDTWLPTAEDVLVQKLRWGRPKDLDDARDVLAVQGAETLDMAYIGKWCVEHGTMPRLRAALAAIPPL